MEKIISFLIIVLVSFETYAQSSNIDAKSITAAKYADQAAINAAITSPEEGMLVYNIALKSYMVYDGTAWSVQGGGSSGWGLTGNAGTDATTNFIGTTDNKPLYFRANNLPAGELNPTTFNISYGFNSLSSNTGGYSNIAIGTQTLFSNTDGFGNTALGSSALVYNTTGNNNTASGSRALYSNSTGIYNTASGSSALKKNTTGSSNTASGTFALENNTNGSANTALGRDALRANTTGDSNTASGTYALTTNTTGKDNTALGESSLRYNTTGRANLASGKDALLNNTTGNGNTGSGNDALKVNTTGSNNTSIGNRAGSSNISGSNNTYIGNLADGSSSGFSNSTAIGSGAAVNASNKVRIGNSSVTVIEGQVSFTNPSDRRLKENIVSNDDLGLEFVNRLLPVSYNYISDASKIRHDGFIAQEVESVMNDLGVGFSGLKKDSDGMYSLAYSDFVMPLVNAVKELKAENDKLKIQVARISEIDELRSELASLKALLKGGTVPNTK